MKLHLAVFFIVIQFTFSCIEEKTIMEVKYFEAGKENIINLQIEKQKKVLEILVELISNSTDVLRLIVDEERINSLKQTETCAEILFAEHRLLTSEVLGEEKVKKVFLAFTGDFVGNEDDPIITIFLGDEEYFSGPYRNDNGYNKLMELKNTITSN